MSVITQMARQLTNSKLEAMPELHPQDPENPKPARRRSSEDGNAGKVSTVRSLASEKSGTFNPERRGSDETIADTLALEHGEVETDGTYLTEEFSKAELKWVILPSSRFRIVWDAALLCLVLYTSVSLPVMLSFALDTKQAVSVQVVEIFIDVVFLIDIVLNFNTAVVRDSILIIDKKAIASKYAKRWLAIDAASSVPWEVIFLIIEASNGSQSNGADGSDLGTLGALKVLKVPKLLRLGRVFKILERVQGAANVSRIVMLVVGMAMVIHWLCAVWYVLAKREGKWLDSQTCPGCITTDDEGELALREQGIWSQYAFSYYTTLMMMMGDSVSPTDGWEVLFASFVGLLGACVNAYVFATVAHLVAQLSAESAVHQARMNDVTSAMMRLRVNDATARRVRAYFEYRWVRHRDHSGDAFIRSLPLQLRSDVSCMVHHALIRRCPLFHDADRRLLAAIATALVPEVYLPSEFILVAGFVSSCMYFISKGRVLVMEREQRQKSDAKAEQKFESALLGHAGDADHMGKDASAKALLKGKWLLAARRVASGVRVDYFGERGLFAALDQKFHEFHFETSARALTHVDLYGLDRENFEQICADYPTAALKLVDSAKKNMPIEFAAAFARKVETIVHASDEAGKAADEQRSSEGGEALPPPRSGKAPMASASSGAGDFGRLESTVASLNADVRQLMQSQREMQRQLETLLEHSVRAAATKPLQSLEA